MDALNKRFVVVANSQSGDKCPAPRYTLKMIRTVYGAHVADEAKMLKVGKTLTTPSGDRITRED